MTNDQPGTGRSPYAARKHDHHNPLAGGKVVPSKALAAAGTPSSDTFLRGDDTWAEIPPAAVAVADDDTDIDSPIENVNAVTITTTTYTLPDVTLYTMHSLTLATTSTTLTFPAAAAGKSFALEVIHTGASLAITWPTVTWEFSIVPAQSTTSGSVDCFAFACFDGTNWRGFFAGKAMA